MSKNNKFLLSIVVVISLLSVILNHSPAVLGKEEFPIDPQADLIDRANPIAINETRSRKIGQFDENYGFSYDIFVEKRGSKTYGYVADFSGGLLILDVSKPEKPKYLGKFTNTSFCSSIGVKDGKAYVGGIFGGITIFDVSNPASPKKIGAYDNTTQALKIAFFKDYLVLADSIYGLLFVDIADSENPQLHSSYIFDDMYFLQDFQIQDDLAFTVGSRLEILDLSNLSSITKIGSFEAYENYRSQGIRVYENTAILFVEHFLVQIVDISDLTQPKELFRYFDEGKHFCDGVVIDDYLYILENFGLIVFNYTNPAQLEKLTEYQLAGYYRNIFVSLDHLYLVDSAHGIKIIQISSNPTELQFIGYFQDGGAAYDICVKNNIAYVANGYNGLLILDVKNPYNPKFLGNSFSQNSLYTKIAVQDNLAILTNQYSRKLEIFDISDPTNPIKLTPDLTENDLMHSSFIEIVNNKVYYLSTLYRASYGSQCILEIFNITDENSLTLLGEHYFEGQYSHALAVQNDLVFLGFRREMHIFNASDPTSLEALSVYSPGDFEDFGDIEIHNHFAFCAIQDFGLRIINIGNPSSPVEIGSYKTSTSNGYSYTGGRELVFSNDFIYMTDIDDGVLAFDVFIPSNPLLVGSYSEITAARYIESENFGANLYNLAVHDNIVYLASELDGIILVHFNDAPFSQGVVRRNILLSGAIIGSMVLIAIPIIVVIRVRKRRNILN